MASDVRCEKEYREDISKIRVFEQNLQNTVLISILKLENTCSRKNIKDIDEIDIHNTIVNQKQKLLEY